MTKKSIHIKLTTLHDKPILANLVQLYLHDLSEFEEEEINDNGLFSTGEYFDMYWTEQDRFPYLMYVDGRVIGFALVRCIGDAVFSMAEFFVLRMYRGKGFAKESAFQIFSQFNGQWQVAQLESNEPAQMFWRKVIKNYTGDNYTELWSEESPRGPKQIFDNSTIKII